MDEGRGVRSDTFPRLLGDVGGTHARFAWQAEHGAAPSDIAVYPSAEHSTLHAALTRYLESHDKPAARAAAIGIATAVTGDHVQMTNHHWSFSIAQLKASLALERLLVINDFTALALALPALAAHDVRQVGPGVPATDAPLGLLGPGTGLGVSGLLPAPSGPYAVAISGEGGHVTLAAATATQDLIVKRLRERFGHVSAERVLSGPGLVNLHEAVMRLNGAAPASLDATQITARAMAGSDPACVQATDLFFSFLGNVARNLALTLGARGGVYIGGGIVPKLGTMIDRSRFREAFEGDGRFRPYLAEIPTFVVTAGPLPALIGAARALDLM